MKTIRIVGAGMSGLLCAYYAVQRGFAVEIFEQTDHAGGKIQTLKGTHGLMETAANALLVDLEVERVAHAIGVHLVNKSRLARRRWVFRDKPRRWPLGSAASASLVRFMTLKSLGSSAVRPRPGEILEHWGQRVLGAEATQYLVAPACLGIFGVGPAHLSATLVYNYLFRGAKRTQGRLRGSVAPEGGMGEFPQKLRVYLETKGVKFHFQSTRDAFRAGLDEVIIATDMVAAAEILERNGDGRGTLLKSLPMVGLHSVNVFTKKSPETREPGFGLLFPRDQGFVPLGVLYNSDIFEGRGKGVFSETWIFGDAPETQSDEDLMKTLLEARKKLWGASDTPVEFHINRWPKAIPLYGPHLEQVLSQISVSRERRHLMGNYLGEIGLNRLFHRARNLVNSI